MVARLSWAHNIRLQQLRPFLLTTNVSNKSGNLLFAPQKLPRFKLQELGQLEILAWQLSTPQKLPRFKLQELGQLEILAWQLST